MQRQRFLGFFDRELWGTTILKPLDQNECLVSHLKDLFCICLEPEIQGRGSLLNLDFALSK